MAEVLIYRGAQCIRQEVRGEESLSALLENAGIHMAHPCGGRGVCGKCAVSVTGEVSPPDEAEKKAGTRLACRIRVFGNAEVYLPDEREMQQIETGGALPVVMGAPRPGMTGAAVDIGTTTVVLRRYDLGTGEILGESAMANPQITVAADVMGRIGASLNGQSEKLQRQISDCIRALLAKAGGRTDRLVVTGNTTMLYLLTGRDPEALSHAPFEADTLFDTDYVLDGKAAYLPPCMNAFVGADISCAVLASGMCGGGTAMLCDVGTNGEIALWKDGVLYVTSTAAGPAFEGAGISCGVSSIRGAVDRVWIEGGMLSVHTIGNAPAAGLCGSGLIDAIASLLELEEIDETGSMEEDGITVAPGVVLTQKDVRAVQLAKSAIAAGIATLLSVSETDPSEIGSLYIAGGFGSHLGIMSAAAIGLIPRELIGKVRVIGNAALTGAAQLLLDEGRIPEIRRIAASSKHWNLGGNPLFNELYMENMLFPEVLS